MSPEPAWPFDVDGVVEAVIATEQPAGGWNMAALGIRGDRSTDRANRARTWGQTRTRNNFERTGEGVVQLLTDPRLFTRAALDRWVRDDRIHPEASAWVEVAVEREASGSQGGTEWIDWRLKALDGARERLSVLAPTRGFPAIIELTIAASRLGIPEYEDDGLRDRMDYFATVAETCGGGPEREALETIERLSDWERS